MIAEIKWPRSSQRNKKLKFASQPFHQLLNQHDEEKLKQSLTGWKSNPSLKKLKDLSMHSKEMPLCVDMRMANRAILRERHPTPIVEEITHALNGTTIFSKFGYHQLSLASESR